MNILSLNFFKLLHLQTSKLKNLFAASDEAEDEPEPERRTVDRSPYTMVDLTHDKRKLDLLTTVHMSSRQLESAKNWQKTGKSRWHQNKNQQHYKPKTIKLDPHLEFVYDELGLSKDLEQTTIGPSNR